MQFGEKIFKSYDIRGTYPDQLTEEVVFGIGVGFMRFLRKKHPKIAVGRDARLSSPLLFSAFAKGVRQEGGDIIDLGVITTPMLYFAVAEHGYDGGAMITASHNPNPYNGLKLIREKARPIGEDSGLFDIRDALSSLQLSSRAMRGRIQRKNIAKAYGDFVFRVAGFKKGELRGMRIVLDAGNGTGGAMALEILERAGALVSSLYIEPDGRFPNHVPDPLQKQNLRDLIAEVKKTKADLGVALDGDADRVVFVTERGEAVAGDMVTGLLAQIILEKKKGKILYDIRSSNAIPETIKEHGGTPVVSRIGHAFIKEKMRKEKILFGGEFSGHYYWGAPYNFDIPFVALLLIAQKVKESPLSQLLAPLQRYAQSGEINFEIAEKQKAIAALREKYGDGKRTKIDGLRVDYEDWWFLVRPSNTEAKVRLVVEAKTKQILGEKKKELVGFLTRFPREGVQSLT